MMVVQSYDILEKLHYDCLWICNGTVRSVDYPSLDYERSHNDGVRICLSSFLRQASMRTVAGEAVQAELGPKALPHPNKVT
jgi:hypothetical protein